MTRPRAFRIAFGAALALLEYLLYFRPDPHFFVGDTIHWFYVRHHSIRDFVLSFFRLDGEGWYRPLTDCTVQSLLYPFFGLQVTPYRIVHYVLFMAVLFVVYKLAFAITHKRIAAALATVFFGIHTTNAFITYDLLFTPEVLYSLFYICAAIAYIRYRENRRTRFLAVSVACFAASLFSKEAAVTAPITLVALDVLLNRTRLKEAILSVKAHAAVLAVYLLLVAGYLGVQRPAFRSLIHRPGPEVAYRFALDRTVLNNARLAAAWAFNLPRGWQLESPHMPPRSFLILRIFRLLVLLLAAWLLLRRESRSVLAGSAWFLITVAPGLPLFEHFLPYYLFLPVVGLSVIVGVAADAVYSKIGTYNRPLAAAVVTVPLIVLGMICAATARDYATGNAVLGRSSKLALNTLNDLRAAYPTLQPNTTLYFSDAEDPDLSSDTSQGELFKLAYGDDSLQSLYWGWGEVITKGVLDRGPVVVLKYHDFHVSDITLEFLAGSEPPVSYFAPPLHEVKILEDSTAPGRKYQILISGVSNVVVVLHYSRDGGPVQAFSADLDQNQQTIFYATDETPKGLYKIVGFRAAGWDHFEQAAASFRIN
jgi:hypothetical protein